MLGAACAAGLVSNIVIAAVSIAHLRQMASRRPALERVTAFERLNRAVLGGHGALSSRVVSPLPQSQAALTELGLDFWARQVPAEPGEREEMTRTVGTEEIPVLVPDSEQPLCGEEEILQYLSRFDRRQDAEAHRQKAREEVPTFVEVQGAG
jgi:glutathione S-transferase-like protein